MAMSSMKDRETMKVSINNKLRSTAGESISETLVALLISALALVMLAGAISAASRIVMKSRSKLETYYDKNETLVNLSAGSNAGSVTITEPPAPGAIADDDDTESIPIVYYENDAFSKNKVIAYRKNTNAGN